MKGADAIVTLEISDIERKKRSRRRKTFARQARKRSIRAMSSRTLIPYLVKY